jgi:large subunit ribosomal protein L21
MYAVVEIAGQQYKVAPSNTYYVPRLEGDAGTTVKFDKVLLLANENTITIGAPIINGIKVEATVLGHVKDDKVIVFKKKRRKGYRVKKGHRQQYTQIEITNIG